MDDELDDGVRSLSDAALVHAAKLRIVRALAELKDHPLDEDAVGQMREVLGEPVRSAQAALRRLAAKTGLPAGAPTLHVVATDPLTTDAGGALPALGDAPLPGFDSARRCTFWAPGGAA